MTKTDNPYFDNADIVITAEAMKKLFMNTKYKEQLFIDSIRELVREVERMARCLERNDHADFSDIESVLAAGKRVDKLLTQREVEMAVNS